MKIETKFDLGQRVWIIEAGYQPARIDQIKLVGKNLIYGVYYYLEGKVQNLDIWEDELVGELPRGNGTGFQPALPTSLEKELCHGDKKETQA